MAVVQTCSVTWVAETVVPVPGAVQVDESPREHCQEVVGQDLDPGVDPEMSSTINLQPIPPHKYWYFICMSIHIIQGNILMFKMVRPL